MHIKSFRVRNFRRLRDVKVDLDADTSVFVGANNSGKTSATHVFQSFLGKSRGEFQIYDFAASCWPVFDGFDADQSDPD
ncbi:MAG TPA: AAA family ATPase, partial [Baekduia sp.]|nr:AAA family ATPase [Baekduia sp.]